MIPNLFGEALLINFWIFNDFWQEQFKPYTVISFAIIMEL